MAFRAASTIPTDMRAYMLASHYVFSPEMAVANFHPRFWSLNELHDDPQVNFALKLDWTARYGWQDCFPPNSQP
jgi:hypothetical protein